VTVYHCLSHTFTDQLRRPIIPGLFVDITETIPLKRNLLSCHRSQKEWLDVSQGNAAYLNNMEEGCRHIGEMSKRCKFAEGWVRHNHVGYCAENENPLVGNLGESAFINEEFESTLQLGKK